MKKYMKSEEISNGAKKRFGFTKSERIRRNSEYKRAYGRGISHRDDIFALVILKNNLGHHRLGISVGTSKVPLSSNRNRLKRLIKEFFRLNKTNIKNGPYDIIVSIAKRPSHRINYLMIETRLENLLRKARAL